MRIFAAVLLFCLWPFHRRAHAPAPTNKSTMTVVGAEDAPAPRDRQGCDLSPELGFVFVGDDGMLGWSEQSCEAAFQAWRHNNPPRIVMHHG
jgi:hypothetical protein